MVLIAEIISQLTSTYYCNTSPSSKICQIRINVDITLIVNIHQSYFRFDIWLKITFEPTYVYRRCFIVGI